MNGPHIQVSTTTKYKEWFCLDVSRYSLQGTSFLYNTAYNCI